MRLRKSRQLTKVLSELLRYREEWRYGYDLSQSTGLQSGTLYPILMELAEQHLLDASWESVETSKRARHIYKLTSEGAHFARTLVYSSASEPMRVPALDGVMAL
jgi:PadR family transcriptional regulator PadR